MDHLVMAGIRSECECEGDWCLGNCFYVCSGCAVEVEDERANDGDDCNRVYEDDVLCCRCGTLAAWDPEVFQVSCPVCDVEDEGDEE
jgi:hypothetical protein